MPKSPNPDIIDKIYFRNIYSCQRKIYWYKVKVMETINAVWEHSYGEDCIPNFSANMEQPRHRWYEFKEGFSLTLVERAIRETKKDNKSTSFTVLDPFSGSGTSPLTALQSRCNAIDVNICANFDILFYLSHPRNKYAEQTLFEINTMLYLAELLSIYDGCNAQKWGYGFARNKYGAPVSIELMEEVEFLCAKGYLSKDSSGYYRISDTASLNSILSISKSGILGWRSKYIEVVFDSLLTKSFPRVVRAVQNEPGISLLESINRTSILLESSLINALYEDFGVLKEIIGDPQIDLVVPASLWIDYLSVQKQ